MVCWTRSSRPGSGAGSAEASRRAAVDVAWCRRRIKESEDGDQDRQSAEPGVAGPHPRRVAAVARERRRAGQERRLSRGPPAGRRQVARADRRRAPAAGDGRRGAPSRSPSSSSWSIRAASASRSPTGPPAWESASRCRRCSTTARPSSGRRAVRTSSTCAGSPTRCPAPSSRSPSSIPPATCRRRSTWPTPLAWSSPSPDI